VRQRLSFLLDLDDDMLALIVWPRFDNHAPHLVLSP
jgi:hypothetical protein